MAEKKYIGSGIAKNYTNKVNEGSVVEIYLRISDIKEENIEVKGDLKVVRLVMEKKDAPDEFGNTHRVFLDRRTKKVKG